MTIQAILQRVYGVEIVAVRQPRDLRLEGASFGLQPVPALPARATARSWKKPVTFLHFP
jgi:hypothetical protein